MCHCGAVVRQFLARADKPGSTPGDAAFCFLVPFFSRFRLFFLTLFFLLAFFSLFFLQTLLLVMHLDQYIFYFKLKSGVLFWKKGFQKLLICILANLTTGQKPLAVKTCPSSETTEFFSMLVDIMTNTHSTPQTVLQSTLDNSNPR